MNTQLKLVRQFHHSFNYDQAPHGHEGYMTPGTALLRYSCITEELGELGMAVCSGCRMDILDALIDMDYFVLGTLTILGSDVKKAEPWTMPSVCSINALVIKIHRAYKPLAGLLLYMGEVPNYATRELIIKECSHLHCLIAALVRVAVKADYEKAFMEVHRSNMSKLENGNPVYNDAGKIQKGSGYFKPDLTPFLVTQ